MFEEVKKEVNEELDKVKDEVVSKKNFSGWLLRWLIVRFGELRDSKNIFKQFGFSLEGKIFYVSVDKDKKVVIKCGRDVVYENFEITEIEDVEFIFNVFKLGGKFDLDESFKEDNKIKFGKGSGPGQISVGKYTTSGLEESRKLICWLGCFSMGFFERFFDRNLTVLASEDGKIGGCDFKSSYDFNDNNLKVLFDEGLKNLFGQKGRFEEKDFVFDEVVNGKLKKIALWY